MPNENWKRIAGIHAEEDGSIGAVWLAHDTEVDVVHVYDSCIFRDQALQFPVIADGLNARGRWIPIAWHKSAKEISDTLLDRGCRMLPEPADETQEMAEVDNSQIFTRMQTYRMKVEERLGDWLDELDRYQKQDGKVPLNGYPLMSATRHAMNSLQYAIKRNPRHLRRNNYPKVAIV